MVDKLKLLIVFSLGMNESSMTNDTLLNCQAAGLELDAARNYYGLATVGGLFVPGQTQAASTVMMNWFLNRPTDFRLPHRLFSEDRSHTTRENIVFLEEELKRNSLEYHDFDITVVSEYWHCLGIQQLFRQLYDMDVKARPSEQKLSVRGIAARIARLGLYRLDPGGTGYLARYVVGRRAHA